eukprot:15444359-Alexandrium_andersonii.AAC.1
MDSPRGRRSRRKRWTSRLATPPGVSHRSGAPGGSFLTKAMLEPCGLIRHKIMEPPRSIFGR